MTHTDLSSPKIRTRHLDRLAIVYVRQSTPHQVADHRESADLQYQLRQRAVRLGWPDARVLVIDDDQGLSGQSIDNRPGFQRLLAEVSLGRAGIVFGREVSRLSRSNKALRGELFTCVPTGSVRSPSGGIARDPDEQVRAILALVFAKFAELGSVPKVNAYFAAHGLQLGVRVYKGPDKGRLVWHPATRRALYEILCHPFYAGAYVYGRCPVDPLARAGGQTRSRRRSAPPEEGSCLLKDHVPAYITWEEYERNQQRLRENDRGRGASRRASGRAPTLLKGRLTCGRCGAPLGARNARPDVTARYACDHLHLESRGPLCQSVSAAAVDRLIESRIFQAVQPASVELSLRAAEQGERDRERLHAHWKQRLERADYEAGLAQRR
jgi:hypothetical protein